MNVLVSIIGILITILFVIGTHESAHFLMARCLNVTVLRFSIGFGKVLYKWQGRSGTEYVIAAIPLGGYVKMLDENEDTVPPAELHKAFNRQSFYKKFLIVLAGPAANILCAILLYWLVFMIGFTTLKPIIGTIDPGSIAETAGLRKQQEITAIDNTVTASWPKIIFRFLVHLGNKDKLVLTVKNPDRSTSTYTLDLKNWEMGGLNPDPLKSVGIIPYEVNVPLLIGKITPNSPAFSSLLKVGDRIKAINQVKVTDWTELTKIIMDQPGKQLQFTISRNNHTLSLPVQIGSQYNFFFKKTGYLGISPDFHFPKTLLHHIQYSPLDSLWHAGQEVYDFTYFNLILFGKMFDGKLSLQSLGGPVAIFESAGDSLNQGFLTFIGFLAFLSISIGIINLLPIPGLDGGHLFIYLIETIIRRPLPFKFLNLLFRLGFIFIFIILIQAITNDFLRMYK